MYNKNAELREGLVVGIRRVLRRALPGGAGLARRYALCCVRCGAESVLTHGAILKRLRMLRAGLPDAPCADCPTSPAQRIPSSGRRHVWGKKPEELWRPAPSRLPAGSISPAVAWPVPGRGARP